MNSGPIGGAGGEECLVRLVEKKSGSGWKWVVEKSEGEDGIRSHFSQQQREVGHPEVGNPWSAVIPWMMAAADPAEKWWVRLRGNPKRLGEISQAAFLLKAETLGLSLALPWGDSERYDFVVWGRGRGQIYRVQVKGTGRLHRRGYEVQPVHSTRGRGKKRYTKKDIDVLAAHVQPLDVWYLIPIEKVGRAKSLRFYPDITSRRPRWERYRAAWEVLGLA